MTDKQTHMVHFGHVRVDLYNGILELDAQDVHSAMLRSLDNIITDVEKEKAELEKENKDLRTKIKTAVDMIEESKMGRDYFVSLMYLLCILKRKGGEGDNDND